MGHEVYSGSVLTFHGLLCVYCFVERLSGSMNVIATKPQTSIPDGDYGCDVCTNDGKLVEMPLSRCCLENGELSFLILSHTQSVLSSQHHSDSSSSVHHREDDGAFKEYFAVFYFILDFACCDPRPTVSVIQFVFLLMMISNNSVFF